MSTIKSTDLNKVHIFISKSSKRTAKTDNWLIYKCVDNILYTDEKGTRERQIRYIEGEPSIFTDEQTNTNRLTQEQQDRKIYRAHFKDNIYMVREFEKNKLEFFRLSNANAGKAGRDNSRAAIYEEFNAEKTAQNSNLKEFTRIEAEYKAMTMPIDDAKAYLLVLYNNPGYASRLETMSSDEIRNDVCALARKDPDKFVKGMETTEAKNKYWIMKAVGLGIIKIEVNGARLSWANGNLLADSVPGIEVVDYVSTKAKTDSRYDIIMDEIKEKVKYFRAPESVDVDKMPLKPSSNSEAKNVYEKAKEYGYFVHRGLKILYNVPGQNEVEFNNITTCLKTLESDPNFMQEIKKHIETYEAIKKEKVGA